MEALTHIVITDDDDGVRNLLSEFLTRYGYKVTTTSNGEELFTLLDKNVVVDLIILDVMLPTIDGIEICRKIRQNSQVPIIMLTAVDGESDRVISLELGADDYLSKPFSTRELLARIKAVLRRTQSNPDYATASHRKNNILEFAGWSLDITNRRLVSPQGLETALSSGMYDILLVFLENPQHILTRDQLLEITKHRSTEPYDRSIDIQISRLRQKLEKDPKDPQIIKTVRNGGYLFATTVTKRKNIATV